MDPRESRQQPEEAPLTVLPTSSAPGPGTPIEQVLFEVKRLIVGQDRMLERILVGLLAGCGQPGGTRTTPSPSKARIDVQTRFRK